MLASRWWRAGYITSPSPYRPIEKRRASTPKNPCACNRIFRKDISRSGFRTIMAIAITNVLLANLRSRSATCQTKPTPTRRSPPFSDVKANGLNQPRILKRPSLSIQRTQTFFLTLVSTTWLSAISRLLTRFLIGLLLRTHKRSLHAE